MGPIVRLGETLFSFGTLQGGGDFRRPVAWRSPDGATWEFIESRSDFYQYGGLTEVIASDSGLVAVTDGGLIAPYQTAWRWTSGSSWTKSSLASTSERPLMIDDLVWSGGTYLAAGSRYDPRDAEQWWQALEPGLWRSEDGLSWTAVPLPSGMDRGCALAATVDGFLFIGHGLNGSTAWSSTTGSEWSMIGSLDSAADATCWDGLSAVGSGFVALRNAGDSLVISASRDAAAWSTTEHIGLRSSDTLVAALGESVLIFAQQTSGGGATIVLRTAID
jgi:hypothetical protein